MDFSCIENYLTIKKSISTITVICNTNAQHGYLVFVYYFKLIASAQIESDYFKN